MMPKLHSDNYEELDLIRPLYLVHEDAIISWAKYNELTFINCACRFTEKCAVDKEGMSKRKEMKELVKNFKKINPEIDNNIFKALDNINMNCILGWHKDGEDHSFLDEYKDR